MKNKFFAIRLKIGTAGLILAVLFVARPFSFPSFDRDEASYPPHMSPLNKDFAKHLENERKGVFRPVFSADGHPLGLIPSPHEISYPAGAMPAVIASLPSSFDWRGQNKLTPVRNQGDCGSCWAFGAYASLESFLRPAENWDFSEQNLIDRHDFDYGPCFGGNLDMAIAYLARWSGPVNEEDDPYIYAGADTFKVRKHVQDVIYIPSRAHSLDNGLIKQAVMTYGAVYTPMFYKGAHYNSTNKSYHNPTDKEGGHAVAIVGWDDDFDRNKFNTPPPGNGAFIVKNSWGAGWGEMGYFYVSYHDAFFGRRWFNAALKAEPSTAYSVIYQYDPLGWTSSLGYGSDGAWFADIFTASTRDPLLAVSFHAAGSMNNYEVFIYKDVADGQPRSGTLVHRETGAFSSPCYFTVPLRSAVSLVQGQKFSVVIWLQTVNYNYPIPFEYPHRDYSSQAKAAPGQSFISRDGSDWGDLHIMQGGQFANSNVCLKAFAGLPPVYPPLNFALKRLENNFYFFKEYIDRLSWENNPKNKTRVVKFRIYKNRKAAATSSWQAALELEAGTLAADFRGLKKDELYAYRVAIIDEHGRESDPAEIN